LVILAAMEVGILGLAGGVLTTFATAATTWFFSRRQAKVELAKLEQEIETMRTQRTADVKSAEVEIMEKYRELYNNLVEDLGKQLHLLKQENTDIRKEVADRRELTDKMIQEMRNVETEAITLRKEIVELRNDNVQLRAEMAQLKSDFPCVDCPRRSR